MLGFLRDLLPKSREEVRLEMAHFMAQTSGRIALALVEQQQEEVADRRKDDVTFKAHADNPHTYSFAEVVAQARNLHHKPSAPYLLELHLNAHSYQVPADELSSALESFPNRAESARLAAHYLKIHAQSPALTWNECKRLIAIEPDADKRYAAVMTWQREREFTDSPQSVLPDLKELRVSHKRDEYLTEYVEQHARALTLQNISDLFPLVYDGSTRCKLLRSAVTAQDFQVDFNKLLEAIRATSRRSEADDLIILHTAKSKALSLAELKPRMRSFYDSANRPALLSQWLAAHEYAVTPKELFEAVDDTGSPSQCQSILREFVKCKKGLSLKEAGEVAAHGYSHSDRVAILNDYCEAHQFAFHINDFLEEVKKLQLPSLSDALLSTFLTQNPDCLKSFAEVQNFTKSFYSAERGDLARGIYFAKNFEKLTDDQNIEILDSFYSTKVAIIALDKSIEGREEKLSPRLRRHREQLVHRYDSSDLALKLVKHLLS